MTGFLDTIAAPAGYLLRFCYNITGNYASAVILLAFFTALLLLPLTIWRKKKAEKLARMTPEIQKIRDRYKDAPDAVRQGEEISALYKKNGYRAFSSCVPTIIQILVTLLVLYAVASPLTFISELSMDSVSAVTATPSLSNVNRLVLVPVLGLAVSLIHPIRDIVTKRRKRDGNMKSKTNIQQAISIAVPPLLTMYIMFSVPAVVGIYWIAKTVITNLLEVCIEFLRKIARRKTLPAS